MEPVAVAVRSATEVWVVNHLSDSISIVDLSGPTPRVTRTLLVGDEPRDLVFAGPGGGRAFVTTAHRGQQRTSADLAGVPGAGDPQFATPGVGRADVWVFDAADPGPGLGGRPLRIVTLFGDTPRALATSPDGSTVYAAVFKSGNRTTAIGEGAVCNGFDQAAPCTSPQGFSMPGGLPPPSTNALGEPAPETGLIVKYDPPPRSGRTSSAATGATRCASRCRTRTSSRSTRARSRRPRSSPTSARRSSTWPVNPVTGVLYVSNTEARNEVRFEGPGTFADTTVQGHLAEARITVVSGANVLPRHLNKHIDYDTTPAPAGTKAHSLATPVGMASRPTAARSTSRRSARRRSACSTPRPSRTTRSIPSSPARTTST
jgi:DNA-binding beta-propeller fold protein YncE